MGGCVWSRPKGGYDSQKLHPALSHNHRAGSHFSPAGPVAASQIGSRHVGLRSKIAKHLGSFLGKIAKHLGPFLGKDASSRSSQDKVSSEGSAAPESLQQPSSVDNSALLTLFKSFNAEVDGFVHRHHPDDEEQRRQACGHIYDQVIRFLMDENRSPQKYKDVARTLTQDLHLPHTERFDTNLEIVAICRYGEKMKKTVLVSDCDYTFEYSSEGTQQDPVLKEDGRTI